MERMGWYTPADLRPGLGANRYDELAILLEPLVPLLDVDGRGHELIHCLDVGIGAKTLATTAWTDTVLLSRHPELTTDLDIVRTAANGAFYSGVFHDLVLAVRGDLIDAAIPEREIEMLVHPDAHGEFKGKAQYLKDAVGDDLRGEILLRSAVHNTLSLGEDFSSEFHKRIMQARQHLWEGADLPLRHPAPKSAFGFNPYKVLDAIWYHDGNSPIRGHAETDALIGDRLTLYESEKVPIDVVGAGIDKILGYTAPDPKWEARQTSNDMELLQQIIRKKAGIDLTDLSGTQTYDLIVNDLARRDRAQRTINSPAFWRGVDKMPWVIRRLEDHAELREQFGPKIDELHRRYEAVQQYRPR